MWKGSFWEKRRIKTILRSFFGEEKPFFVKGLFWDKMNSEIFSCLEFHTVDEKRRAEVGLMMSCWHFVSFWNLSIFVSRGIIVCLNYKCEPFSASQRAGGERRRGHGWKDQGLVQKISCWKSSGVITQKLFVWKDQLKYFRICDNSKWKCCNFSFWLCDCVAQAIRRRRHGLCLIKSGIFRHSSIVQLFSCFWNKKGVVKQFAQLYV